MEVGRILTAVRWALLADHLSSSIVCDAHACPRIVKYFRFDHDEISLQRRNHCILLVDCSRNALRHVGAWQCMCAATSCDPGWTLGFWTPITVWTQVPSAPLEHPGTPSAHLGTSNSAPRPPARFGIGGVDTVMQRSGTSAIVCTSTNKRKLQQRKLQQRKLQQRKSKCQTN